MSALPARRDRTEALRRQLGDFAWRRDGRTADRCGQLPVSTLSRRSPAAASGKSIQLLCHRTNEQKAHTLLRGRHSKAVYKFASCAGNVVFAGYEYSGTELRRRIDSSKAFVSNRNKVGSYLALNETKCRG